jgi:hypothetical protein
MTKDEAVAVAKKWYDERTGQASNIKFAFLLQRDIIETETWERIALFERRIAITIA